MKKSVFVLAVIVSLFFVGVTNVQAKDMSGRFGIGVDGSLHPSSDRGLAFTYYFHKYFGAQFYTSANVRSTTTNAAQGGDVTQTISDWLFGARVMVPAILTKEVNLVGLLGFNVGGEKSAIEQGSKTNENSYTTFWIDFGMRPEWFINDHFSIHTQLGMTFHFITEDEAEFLQEVKKTSGIEFRFAGIRDLSAQIGFTFYL